ncbi:MAG: acyl-CoA/acyl-ACP dehydrogenase [Deltaproteobacteria bacterium]|nr:acyl-CoA/acyl-ACP dehydrogenase [Deltaproteobacteria bacterium]
MKIEQHMPADPIHEVVAECRKFLKNEIRDHVLEADLKKDTNWVNHVWQKSRQLDLPILLIPEAYNGAGFSQCSCALLLDLISSECAGIASVFALHFAGCIPFLSADENQQRSFFSLLSDDNNRKSALISPVFPSETDGHRLEVEEQNSGLVISGTTSLAGNALAADLFCLFIEDGDTTGEDITCVVLKKETPGLSLGRAADFPGLKTNAFAPIVLDRVIVDKQAIIGKRKQAKAIMENAKNSLFRFVAATAMGAARNAYEKAAAYARRRYQFGKMIIHHQQIQRMLGSMQMKLSMGTAGYLNSFGDKEMILPFSKPKPALVKVFCTAVALEIVFDAIQIHGGYGYMHEYGLEKTMRDTKVLQLMLGRNPKCQIDVIAGELQNDR